MPKRQREDSLSGAPTSSSPTPDLSDPASADEPEHSKKYIQTWSIAGISTGAVVMKCSLPPHDETLEFSSFEEFEIHYAKVHAYRCSQCHRNMPTEHFLDLHIAENHDPLSEAKRARGEKTNYDFLTVNTGIDKRSSMLRPKHRRRSSASAKAVQRERRSNISLEGSAVNEQILSEAHSVSDIVESETPKTVPLKESSQNVSIDDLTSAMSSLKFVPPSIRFGRGNRRGGLSRT
ncbi:hypothetical protein ACLMJK_009646 [Lecanora helva]